MTNLSDVQYNPLQKMDDCSDSLHSQLTTTDTDSCSNHSCCWILEQLHYFIVQKNDGDMIRFLLSIILIEEIHQIDDKQRKIMSLCFDLRQNQCQHRHQHPSLKRIYSIVFLFVKVFVSMLKP